MSPWAVKRVNLRHENSEYSARLEAEAKVLRTLSHPHIIGYRGFEKTDAGQFIFSSFFIPQKSIIIFVPVSCS